MLATHSSALPLNPPSPLQLTSALIGVHDYNLLLEHTCTSFLMTTISWQLLSSCTPLTLIGDWWPSTHMHLLSHSTSVSHSMSSAPLSTHSRGLCSPLCSSISLPLSPLFHHTIDFQQLTAHAGSGNIFNVKLKSLTLTMVLPTLPFCYLRVLGLWHSVLVLCFPPFRWQDACVYSY